MLKMNLGIAGLILVAVLSSFAQAANFHSADEACSKLMLFKARKVVGWSSPSQGKTFFFTSGLAIDADGAFKAYHPLDRPGLDALHHAGHPGDWWALITDTHGRPVLQQKGDPAPGYYVSTTSLSDPKNLNWRDPHKFVDSLKIPYIALVPKALKHARLGDFATVVNLRNGKSSGAIVADVTDASLPLGEGSIALAKALGVDWNPRTGGVERPGFFYVVYPGSGNGTPRTTEEILANSQRLFAAWGGFDRLRTCANARGTLGVSRQ
jgi:hypothetical protein